MTHVDARDDVVGDVDAPQWRRHAAEHGVSDLNAGRLPRVFELVRASVAVVTEAEVGKWGRVRDDVRLLHSIILEVGKWSRVRDDVRLLHSIILEVGKWSRVRDDVRLLHSIILEVGK